MSKWCQPCVFLNMRGVACGCRCFVTKGWPNMAANKKAAAKPTKTLEQTLWDAADKLRGSLYN